MTFLVREITRGNETKSFELNFLKFSKTEENFVLH